jgi:HSP20 family protein
MAPRNQEVTKSRDIPVRGGGLDSLRDEVNRLFGQFAGLEWPAVWSGEENLGHADLSETDSNYELQIDLPGMKKDDIAVDLSGEILTISGERSDEHQDERKGYYFSERSYGSVRRSFRVPASVKIDDIRAEFKDGVLTLTMPKTDEAQKSARRIDIE